MSKPLSKEAWAALSAGVMALGVNGSVGMNAMGGKWGEGPTDKTSYPHRGFLFNLEMNAVWYDEAFDDKVKTWVSGSYPTLWAMHLRHTSHPPRLPHTSLPARPAAV